MTDRASPTRDAELAARAEREAHRQRLDAFFASRDAGHTLTLDSLRAGITLKAVVSAATSVADFADQALAIITEEYRPALHCKEGCADCCRKPGVLISVPELLRIVSHIQSSWDEESRAALAARARRYAAQIEGRCFDDATNESVPCPLLVEERCSVYEVRPLVCRGYNSTSVDACRSAHADARQLVPIFSVLKDVTDGATVGTAQCLGAAGVNGPRVDLGSALNIALTAGEEFADEVLQGSAVLAPAQNSTWVEELWARVQETAALVERSTVDDRTAAARRRATRPHGRQG
jgi:Fe-S-cluster containining protein